MRLTEAQRERMQARRRENQRQISAENRATRAAKRTPDARDVANAMLRLTLPSAYHEGRPLKPLVDLLVKDGFARGEASRVVAGMIARYGQC